MKIEYINTSIDIPSKTNRSLNGLGSVETLARSASPRAAPSPSLITRRPLNQSTAHPRSAQWHLLLPTPTNTNA